MALREARIPLSRNAVSEMMGQKLDRFELITELASGGMGTVYLARLGGAGGFQRLYAIKVLHEHLAKHSEFIEMFLDEARLAASIHHPNVVSIVEIGASEAGHYLVMDYVEGDTAAQLFSAAAQDKKRVPIRVILRIVLDVLAGLHAAHERQDDEGHPLEIVHRDVSPHNILVGVDGASRITDFGIARAATRLAITRSGQLKGKLAYMAPEQARSESVDRRADVFAMGICLWEMLTGDRLFKADGEGETLNRVLYEPIPTPRSVDPEIPPEIDEVCMKALTRDPDARYLTAAEFADALERAARALDVLGSHREVAASVSDHLGADVKERRAELRAWLGDSERRASAPNADSSGELASLPGAGVSVYVPPLLDSGYLPPVAKKRSSAGGRALGAAIGVALVASVGFAFLRKPHAATEAPSAATHLAPANAGASPLEPVLARDTTLEPVLARDTPPASPAPDPSPAALAQASPQAGEPRAAPSPASPAAAPAASSTPSSSPRSASVAAAAAPPRGVTAPAAAKTRPGSASAPASPSSGVPADMLKNPYR
jgi:serine/threonine-protein kinase